jgi:hypothetical protein
VPRKVGPTGFAATMPISAFRPSGMGTTEMAPSPIGGVPAEASSLCQPEGLIHITQISAAASMFEDGAIEPSRGLVARRVFNRNTRDLAEAEQRRGCDRSQLACCHAAARSARRLTWITDAALQLRLISSAGCSYDCMSNRLRG